MGSLALRAELPGKETVSLVYRDPGPALGGITIFKGLDP